MFTNFLNIKINLIKKVTVVAIKNIELKSPWRSLSVLIWYLYFKKLFT